MTPKLVGYPVSPFVRKVRVALEHKGIDYKLDPVNPYTDRNKVLPLNPAGTVPVLVPGDSGAPITESADIILWTEGRMIDPVLIPTDPASREAALRWQGFADTKMARVFGGMMFGQRIVVPYYFGRPEGKEALVQKAMTELAPPLLKDLDNGLRDQEFLVGSFSVADIAATSWLRGAELAGFDLDVRRWPELKAWLDRCYAQTGFASVIASEDRLDVVQWARQRWSGDNLDG